MAKDFFENATNSSKVKISMVSQYFAMWSNVMKKKKEKIAFIDLFAGPGYYDDGTPSVPIRVMEHTISEPVKRKKVQALFNDGDPHNVELLKENLKRIEGYEQLEYEPIVENEVINADFKSKLEGVSFVPTLLYVDPYGYSGLTMDLVGEVLKDWGCDCIFFFNYNRFNAGIENPSLEKGAVQSIFGEDKTAKLKDEIMGKNPKERELHTLNFLREELKSRKGSYTLAFRFRQTKKEKTGHYLILTSKHPLAHKLFKDIAYRQATSYLQAYDAFEYNPKDHGQIKIWDIANPEELANDLIKEFKGCQIKVKDVFMKHHMGTPYLITHYKNALLYLKKLEKVEPIEDGKKRKKDSMADDLIVKFKN